jgi:DoxX-like family
MDATITRPSTSRTVLWISYVISAIPVLMMIMSGIMKFIPSQALSEGFEHLGWPISQASILAILELGCVVIYLIPRTAILGAILMTGYLGGATATHVRVTDAQFFIPTLLGVFAWLGLWLREPRLKALLPFRS